MGSKFDLMERFIFKLDFLLNYFFVLLLFFSFCEFEEQL